MRTKIVAVGTFLSYIGNVLIMGGMGFILFQNEDHVEVFILFFVLTVNFSSWGVSNRERLTFFFFENRTVILWLL